MSVDNGRWIGGCHGQCGTSMGFSGTGGDGVPASGHQLPERRGPISRPEKRLPSRNRATPTIGVPARSEEHTSELQSLMRISYAVFCLKKKKNQQSQHQHRNTMQAQNNKEHT